MSWKAWLKSIFRDPPPQTLDLRPPAAPPDSPTHVVTKTIGESERQGSAVQSWTHRYRTVRTLGQGGMGSVLLAERLSDSTLVCLKFLHKDTDRRTLQQECRALIRLRHPAIISLLDFSLEDFPPWLATEYAPGPTLSNYLAERGPLPIASYTSLLKSLLQGLDYAHSQVVIHRDLKPSNMIVDASDDRLGLRILDFGVAIVDQYDHEDRLTAGDADPLGTLLYMAPEQLEGQVLTSACDLYSVGLISWEMLTGRNAFEGKSRSQMLTEKMLGRDGLRLEQPPGVIPAILSEFVQACTQFDPKARPTAKAGLAVVESLTKSI